MRESTRSIGQARRRTSGLAWLLATVLVLAPAALASAEDATWAPSPSDADYDWLRIDSGEWLKGELIVLQGNVLRFDSDEFNELEFDWIDVLDLRLLRPRVFRLEGNRILSGIGELHDGVLRIQPAEGEAILVPHADVVSITYTEELELQRWTLEIGASLAARSGNTDQQDLGANALIRRDATFTRWENRYVGAIGRVDGENTTNNHRATTFLDLMVTNRFFVRLPSYEFYSDEFQNIDGRHTAGAGVGYEPIDTPLAELRLSIGSAGQFTDNAGGTRSTDAAILGSTDLSLDLPRDVDLDLRYGLQLLVTDLGRTAHSASAVLGFEIWDPIDLDVGFYWDRIESPERDGDGERPKSDDLRLTVGLSIEL